MNEEEDSRDPPPVDRELKRIASEASKIAERHTYERRSGDDTEDDLVKLAELVVELAYTVKRATEAP